MEKTRTGGARLPTLTALRAIAAFAVFTRHDAEFVFNDLNSHFTRQGATGVSFFFVLSGFVLTWSARPGDGSRQFYRRRLARIYPAYLLVLFITQGATFVKNGASVLAVAANALLVQSWFPTSKVYFASDMGAWSLGCEMFFYLLFPLVLPRLLDLSARRRWQIAGGAVGLDVVIALATHSSEQASGVGLWLVYILPASRIGEFVIGMVLALAVREGLRPRVTLRQASLIALGAYILAGFVPVYLMWVVVTLVPFCLLIVTAAVWDIEGRPTWLRAPMLVRFGNWSYAFYLVHISVVTVLVHLVAGRKGLVTELAVTVAALVVAQAGAGIVHNFVEQPLERRLRGGRPRPRPGNSSSQAGLLAAPAEDAGAPRVHEQEPDDHRERPHGGRFLQSPSGRPTSPVPTTDESAVLDGGDCGSAGDRRIRAGGDVLGALAPAGDAVDLAAAGSLHRDVLHRLRRTADDDQARRRLSRRLHPRRSRGSVAPGLRLSRFGGRRPESAGGPSGGADRSQRPNLGQFLVRGSSAQGDLHACDLDGRRPVDPVASRGHLDPEAVLVVIHYFPPHIGGMEEVGQAQAASLGRRHRDVTLLTCAHERGLPRGETADGYTVQRIRALNLIERKFGVTFPVVGPVGALRIFNAVRKASVVHLHDVFYTTSHVAYLSARLLRRPYYLTQHVATVPHPNRFVMGVQRAVYATIGRAILRRAAGVTTYNARVRDFVIEMGAAPGRVGLHHNGIDTERFQPLPDPEAKAELRRSLGLPVDKPVALFVGRLVPKKGFDMVAAAGTDAWTTVIVGDGAGVALPGGDGVVYFGPARRELVPKLYQAADVFVFPAVGEWFTLAMQEAMASGLPVITTDDPVYCEYALDRDLLGFCPRDPADIRRHIGQVLFDPELASAMGEYSRRIAIERFSWEANYRHEYARYGRDDHESVAVSETVAPVLAAAPAT